MSVLLGVGYIIKFVVFISRLILLYILTDNSKDPCYRERIDKMYQNTLVFLEIEVL